MVNHPGRWSSTLFMGPEPNCLDNTPMESFFHIFKIALAGSTGQRNMMDFMMFREDPRWREPADLADRRSRKGSFGSDGRMASRSVTSDGLSASTRAQSLVCCKPKVALRGRCGSGLSVL